MKRASLALAALLLALGLMLVAGTACGGPHGYEPPALADELRTPEGRRTHSATEMGAWLRQLAGRYHEFSRITIRGVLKNDIMVGKKPDGPIQTGYLDCMGIGTGPGVYCMIMKARHQQGRGDSFGISGTIEFGLDPNASKIHILWADSSGTVQESSATLHDDMATWFFPCPPTGGPAELCFLTEGISMSVDGKYITWSSGRLTMAGQKVTSRYLYRLSPEQASAAFGPDGMPHAAADPNTGSVTDFGLRLRPPGPR